MKQRLAFTSIMGLITTFIISFSLVALNFGFRAGFFAVWLRSWAVSYPLAVMIILLVGPRVQVLASFLSEKSPTRKGKISHV